MKKLLGYIAVILVICALAWFLIPHNRMCGNGRKAVLKTPTETLSVVMALTSEDQALGLGGCTMIPKKTGMYFSFPAQESTYWMKGMVIPIDIVWIAQGVVVGVEASVPFPSVNARDAELPLYRSPVAVDAVLEVGAGMAEAYGLVKGAQVILVE
jgi:uncharacterized membrane protein (UPF0127 family)